MPDPRPLQNAPAVPLEALVTRTFPTWDEAEAWLATLASAATGRTLEQRPSGTSARRALAATTGGVTADGRAITDAKTHTRDIGSIAGLSHGYGATIGRLGAISEGSQNLSFNF
mgnify:FL=1